jgi:hypothetical protein
MLDVGNHRWLVVTHRANYSLQNNISVLLQNELRFSRSMNNHNNLIYVTISVI